MYQAIIYHDSPDNELKSRHASNNNQNSEQEEKSPCHFLNCLLCLKLRQQSPFYN